MRHTQFKSTIKYEQELTAALYTEPQGVQSHDSKRKTGTLKNYTTPGGGVLPYMGYIGMYRCEGYGFQAVYSRIGYINQNIWV